ncbi:MAG: DUF4124 domain-containing protein [Xanthomonadaceae bacterium]|nr:DUF4124 domain-containing protein [Xanthomonadaceae bacterium]
MGRLLSIVAIGFVLPLIAETAPAQDMRVYRCVGRNGSVALRDTPCEANEKQEVQWVKPPQDPVAYSAPSSVNEPQAVPPPPARTEIRVVTVSPPEPLYECVTPDGHVYTSDNAEGNPRWVPLWTLGFPPGAVGSAGEQLLTGSYVRDSCTRLPQREVCSRLTDRRYEILRRYGTVSPTGRRALDREQEVLDARIANDCAGR